MAKLLAPTTKPQVSGYKFLVRRAEHGLIFGDARMIHDPLARMRRSVALGAIACVIFAVGPVRSPW
nr:type VII secretion protein EccB [Corynebacterium pyruviciproducens]